MPTELLPTRTKASVRLTREPLTRSFWLAAGLHVLIVGALLGWSLVHWKRNKNFGSSTALAGSIQASMVHALPLPPRQPVVAKAVLASDKPSVAPSPPAAPEKPQPKVEAKQKPEPPPRTDAIPITKPAAVKPEKATPKVDPTPRPAPLTPKAQPRPEATPQRPEPTPPSPKATTGEAPGTRIPQSMTETSTGIASFVSEERSFGDRYAYYIRLISQKVNQSRASQAPDPPESKGKRTVIRFTIDRDGTPTDAEVQTPSGSSALDRSALRAIQHIDTFGPLPAGDHLTVDFGFADH